MPDINMIECGRLMGNWHFGQWDPVYMVGSLFREGKDYPDLEIVAGALSNIKRDLDSPDGSADSEENSEELANIADFLREYLTSRGYSATELENEP